MRDPVRTGLHRRLAAILIADVVGYSARMAHDEEGTFADIRQLLRENVRPKIEEHNGRVVKTTGDGVVAEFGSPVEAVRTAVEVQQALASQSEHGPGLSMRIGINLGDIIVEADGDIYGDEVNVAARLEQLALPGGICISAKVRDEIRDKLPYSFEHWGEQHVKNIPRPIVVYTLAVKDDRRSSSVKLPPLLLTPNRPSIVVMPFVGTSDVTEPYFVDGFTQDLITELARFNQLTVASHSSSISA